MNDTALIRGSNMARPRVFISSTYFDLKHVRAGLDAFLRELGYDSVTFEKGGVAFIYDESIESSCYREVEQCDILVLIMGGRFGALSESDRSKKRVSELASKLKSVTQREYETALEKGIPTFVFVEKGVLAELETYRRNRGKSDVSFAHVDNVLIYELIDAVMGQKQGNFVRGFESLDDITFWLRDQLAGLFLKLLREQTSRREIRDLGGQIVELRAVVESLKEYSEEIVRSVSKGDAEQVIERVESTLAREKAVGELRKANAFFTYVEDHSPRAAAPIDMVKVFSESGSIDALIDALRRLDYSRETLDRIEQQKELAAADFDAAKLLMRKLELRKK
jgi:hypothetical protein